MLKNDIIILAGGQSTRFGADKLTESVRINKYTSTLDHVLSKIVNNNIFNRIILVANINNKQVKNIVNRYNRIIICKPGAVRLESLKNGLNLVTSNHVFIHDAARAIFEDSAFKEIQEILNINSSEISGVVTGYKITDSVCRINNNLHHIESMVSRDNLVSIQTPAIYNTKKLFDILQIDISNDKDMTDILLESGHKIYIHFSTRLNIKLTHKEDLKDIHKINI